MSGLVKKKVANYLAAREEIETKYASLISKADQSIREELTSLQEFDFLSYSYVALKSYYEISKCKWDLDYRNLLDDLASVNARIEAKLSIRELCDKMPELSVLRREMRERAREAGKISHLMITSSANIQELASIVDEVSVSSMTHNAGDSPVKSVQATPSLSTKTNPETHQFQAPNHTPLAHNVLQDTTSRRQTENQQPNIEVAASGKLASPQAFSLSDSDRKQYRSSSILDIPIQIEALNAQEPTQKHTKLPPQPESPRGDKNQRDQIEAKTEAENDKRPELLHATKPSNLNGKANSTQSRKRSSDDNKASKSVQKRSRAQCTFEKMRQWNREHVKCVISGAYNSNNPTEAISKAFRRVFDLDLTPEEADTLRLHYGLMEPYMEGYRYNIQSFHAVASYFYENLNTYVVTPWNDMRLQYARKTKVSIPDWEIKNRYYLFLLHRRIYGKLGEPASNYHDLVSAFHRINGHLDNSKLPSPAIDSDNSSSAKKLSPLSKKGSSTSTALKQTPKLNYSDSNLFDKWTLKDVEALVEAEHNVPATANYRNSVIMHYIKLKTGHSFSLDEILSRRCQEDVLGAIKKRTITNKPASTIKVLSNLDTEANKGRNSLITNDTKKTNSLEHPPPATNQFDVLLRNIATETREDSYYLKKLPEKVITEFWDFRKTKSLLSTIEYISLIDPETKDVTLRVARLNMVKIAMLRLLRDHQVKILAELIKIRLKRMMEMDVFDEALCRVINEHLHK